VPPAVPVRMGAQAHSRDCACGTYTNPSENARLRLPRPVNSGLESVVYLAGDRGFESLFLQRRVERTRSITSAKRSYFCRNATAVAASGAGDSRMVFQLDVIWLTLLRQRGTHVLTGDNATLVPFTPLRAGT
jgi:hypothetical protein